MKHMSTRLGYTTLGIIASAALLQGCTTGNESVSLGNDASGNTMRLSEFHWQGEAPPAASTGPSTPSLSRANWRPMYVTVPVDGLAQLPTYAKMRTWSKDSARARDQMPTAITALELEGSKPWAQAGEAVMSPLYATLDAGSMLLWDIWWTPPWTEAKLPPTVAYQRAAPETLRMAPSDSAEAAR